MARQKTQGCKVLGSNPCLGGKIAKNILSCFWLVALEPMWSTSQYALYIFIFILKVAIPLGWILS